MTYRETLTYLYSLGRFGMKPGLERITAILAALGRPQERISIVQVAGTNGKGSTAAFLAAIGTAAGLRTGLFSSPHLTSFTERFRVDSKEIEPERVVKLAAHVMAVAPPEATFFEIVTAMAFQYFAEERVDLAIMETGMGGRWDATNAACGILSIITSIGLDHCQYLGDTVAAIAGEKAGIIKPGRPVVTARQEPEAWQVIEERCRELTSPLYCSGDRFTAAWEAEGLAYRGLGVTLTGLCPGIGGRYQAENAGCALAAAELLLKSGFPITGEAMRGGIADARWPGRMELFPGRPPILLDGAHNPAGATALAESLADFRRQRLIMVLGVMCDKELSGILSPLLPLVDLVLAITPNLERAMPAAELANACTARGAAATAAGSVAEGLAQARAAAGPADLILVCGSLFTVGEARSLLTNSAYEPFRG
ncbi:bifunctional folylpolyglutamate synthase/dihydrofolate synthase [Geobacter argillaceus]|uniref:Dihydrofolate synthase/folylpolyglutamate synthase n=1 Tax=Geobacter argillaceus TaxID=345631 RepID=A0A562WRF9_9BACT|nr:folylpolyglutamate synthase/dihydrofolate synthase family protein [Geobacter argillaceus]TWJ32701.1 dihydrofolate synthase/folylpolyglutamate synthase [Geobacter argillaceus]